MTGDEDRNTGKPSWRVRRRIIFATLAYCGASWSYAQLFQGAEMVNAISGSVGWLAAAVIGSYVFGAVWDDRGR